ncbi:DUF885 domain-containing protein [Natrialbaceae archaeon A-CW2]
MSEFERAVDEFLEAYWQHDPVAASHAGIHKYDRQLPKPNPETAAEWKESLEAFAAQFKSFEDHDLTHPERLDRRWALAVIEKLRIDHEERRWAREPRLYLDDLGTGYHDLLLGEFAELETRLEVLSARLRATPAFLEAAQKNIEPENVPPIWIKSAQSTVESLTQFLAEGIPEAAERVPNLEEEILDARDSASVAIEEFGDYLTEISEEASGDYAVGRDRFDRLLQHYHMLDMDADALHDFGREWIDRYEQEMTEVAREIDATSDWVTVLESVKEDHPDADELRQAYEDETMLSREHCLEHDLITFPEGEEVDVEWMPAYMQSWYRIAKPWVTPPFADDLNGKWYITPVDPDATEEEQKEHLRDNSWAWIRGIAQHEMYPGHHLHMAIHKQVATPLRLQFRSPVFTEGWGLYTEELFYETGLLDESELRLMQLRNGLWRAVRIVIDTGLHTRGMAPEEAVNLLVDRARLERQWAESEVERYTMRPTYPSSYRAGLSQLLDIREQYREKHGDDFDYKSFHDELMEYSVLPLSMVEEEML